jgi:hypothetical protein
VVGDLDWGEYLARIDEDEAWVKTRRLPEEVNHAVLDLLLGSHDLNGTDGAAYLFGWGWAKDVELALVVDESNWEAVRDATESVLTFGPGSGLKLASLMMDSRTGAQFETNLAAAEAAGWPTNSKEAFTRALPLLQAQRRLFSKRPEPEWLEHMWSFGSTFWGVETAVLRHVRWMGRMRRAGEAET